ncbi:MAG: hypothetical protein EOO38_13855 [Cytophagaceae bacterium]|nr:MAG: hypothetical protein EOO38_13855 [Cytophagaceae bacterium]
MLQGERRLVRTTSLHHFAYLRAVAELGSGSVRRANACHVTLDVIQAQMGHASIKTTTTIDGCSPIKRRVDEVRRTFS